MLFTCPGIVRIKLPDQTVLEMTTKTVEVTGLLSAEKIYNVVGSLNIHDVSNGVNSEVTFDCNAEKRAGFVSSFFKSVPKNEFGDHENRMDLVEVKLTDDADFEIGKGGGSYLERIAFDGRDFWTVNDKQFISKWAPAPASDVLPSDSSRRPDLNLITAQKWEEAEAAKVELEEA